LWYQLNIDQDLISKADKDAKKASDLAAAGDISGAISTGLGVIPGAGFVTAGIDLASAIAGNTAQDAFKSAIEKLNEALHGANITLVNSYLAYDNWQSDFEDIGYIIESAPKEVCCPPSYDKTGGGKDGAGRDPIVPKNIFTPGHGSYPPPPDILWDPPPGGYPPSKDPTTPSDPGEGGILWDPPLPGGDRPNVPSGPSGSSNPWGPEPYRHGFRGDNPNVQSGPRIFWDKGTSYSPTHEPESGFLISNATIIFNSQPGNRANFYSTFEVQNRWQALLFGLHPDNIWKAEAEKKYYYKPRFR
jgi:hypothetical protein